MLAGRKPHLLPSPLRLLLSPLRLLPVATPSAAAAAHPCSRWRRALRGPSSAWQRLWHPLRPPRPPSMGATRAQARHCSMGIPGGWKAVYGGGRLGPPPWRCGRSPRRETSIRCRPGRRGNPPRPRGWWPTARRQRRRPSRCRHKSPSTGNLGHGRPLAGARCGTTPWWRRCVRQVRT